MSALYFWVEVNRSEDSSVTEVNNQKWTTTSAAAVIVNRAYSTPSNNIFLQQTVLVRDLENITTLQVCEMLVCCMTLRSKYSGTAVIDDLN